MWKNFEATSYIKSQYGTTLEVFASYRTFLSVTSSNHLFQLPIRRTPYSSIETLEHRVDSQAVYTAIA